MQRVFLLGSFAIASLCAIATPKTIPKGFISVRDLDPSLVIEARYYGAHNFVGKRIRGYLAPKCILTRQAAHALVRVQNEVKPYGLTLKIYDCYRPQRAVNHFVDWAKNLRDTKMKKEFYPDVKKKTLFRNGYIASKSGHSRGSTVDLTLIPLPVPKQAKYKDGQSLKDCRYPYKKRFDDNSIDMGTGFDCFDPLSHTINPRIPSQARRNRLLLKSVMEKHGFTNYDKEWWHYTLKDEPFPKQYFDFSVQ